MKAIKFMSELKKLRNAIDNSTLDGGLLCDEVAVNPEIAELATDLANTLRLVAGLELLHTPKLEVPLE